MSQPYSTTGYQELIIEATGCRVQDAAQVEETMRIPYPSLQQLTRRQFFREAQISWSAVKMLRTEGVLETPK